MAKKKINDDTLLELVRDGHAPARGYSVLPWSYREIVRLGLVLIKHSMPIISAASAVESFLKAEKIHRVPNSETLFPATSKSAGPLTGKMLTFNWNTYMKPWFHCPRRRIKTDFPFSSSLFHDCALCFALFGLLGQFPRV